LVLIKPLAAAAADDDLEVGVDAEINSLMPENARIGLEIFWGRDKKISARKMAKRVPKGSQIKRANEAAGVGFRANLPSWKIKGLG